MTAVDLKVLFLACSILLACIPDAQFVLWEGLYATRALNGPPCVSQVGLIKCIVATEKIGSCAWLTGDGHPACRWDRSDRIITCEKVASGRRVKTTTSCFAVTRVRRCRSGPPRQTVGLCASSVDHSTRRATLSHIYNSGSNERLLGLARA